MTDSTRVVVARLTDSEWDGQWREVPSNWNGVVAMQTPTGFVDVQMVPTGNVEWDGNRAAEVWVMKDRLNVWRAEHDVDGPTDPDEGAP